MLMEIVNYIAEVYPLYRASEDAGFPMWSQTFRTIIPKASKEN